MNQPENNNAEFLKVKRQRTEYEKENINLRRLLEDANKRIRELEAAQSMGDWIVVGEIEGPVEDE